MRRLILLAIALTMILGTGYATGLRTNRWGKAEALNDAIVRMNTIPTQFGNWDSREVPIPDDQLQVAEAQGHFSRQFVNSETGHSVSVMILCGSHGPISVHPPTVCFTSAGWQAQAAENLRTIPAIDGSDSQFWVADFTRRENGVPETIRTWWSWNSGLGWQAPERPRVSFAGADYLFKLYATSAIASADAPMGEDPTEQFLNEFLPHLAAALNESDSGPLSLATRQNDQ